MRCGDFPNWKKSNGTLIPIYDPTTTRQDANGTYIRDPFPGNVIPAGKISPISKNFASYLPNPTVSGLVLNYTATGRAPKTQIDNAFVVKVDQSLTNKNKLSYTFTRNYEHFNNLYDTDQNNPDAFNGLPYPLIGGYQKYRGDQKMGWVMRLNDTHILSPTIVNTLTAGFHQAIILQRQVTSVPEGQNWGQKLGGVLNNPAYNLGFPTVTFGTDNYSGYGNNVDWRESNNVYAFEDSRICLPGWIAA
jgi:hypothetical protein